MKEINGYNHKTGQLLKGIGEIQADGSTSTGCWVYAGIFIFFITGHHVIKTVNLMMKTINLSGGMKMLKNGLVTMFQMFQQQQPVQIQQMVRNLSVCQVKA